jgi:hypothetical protein
MYEALFSVIAEGGTGKSVQRILVPLNGEKAVPKAISG